MFQESWHGDYKIYCITAVSEKTEDKGSTFEITEGGLNHAFISLKLKSSTNHGLEYMLTLYANTTAKLY